MLVTCTSIGTRTAENQNGNSLITLVNVMASPVPISTRATIAGAREVEYASDSCPRAMISAPVPITRRDPNRSASSPAGTCIAA